MSGPDYIPDDDVKTAPGQANVPSGEFSSNGGQPSHCPAQKPDHAWKTLNLVIDWIKHAETKAAAVLATAGVAGGVLYNLVKSQSTGFDILNVVAGVSGVMLFASAICSGIALWPRLSIKGNTTSLLYYADIARQYPPKRGSQEYVEALRVVTSSDPKLMSEIASQIWANAHVASSKYVWVSWSTRTLLIGLLGLSIVPVIVMH